MASYIIRWLEEINNKQVRLVGKKSISLSELARAGIQVPSGFVVTLKAHEKMIRETRLDEKIRQYLGRFQETSLKNYSDSEKAGKYIIQMMKGIKLPQDMRNEIFKNYQKLCEVSGIPNVPVSVRSSGPVSHPGLFDTYLNVKGEAELERKVIACWSSVFAPRAIANRAQQGTSIEKEYIGVVILQMVNARSAGVLFSVNPITGNLHEIVVEGSWGVGESVVQASVAPDRFLIDKRTLEIKERVINEKSSEVILTSQGTAVAPVSFERKAMSCLNDDEIRELVRLAKIVEIHCGGIPQDIEWAISADYPFPKDIFFLQTRPVVGVRWESKYFDKPVGKSNTDHIADLMVERLIR
jgi:pyruvate,water dikinase